ncbi:MAG: DUF1553 domain-containing protein [Planctomycetia bacterium]|nr:DUF1553 domain-containing protein [Planctomycetia bacterium]
MPSSRLPLRLVLLATTVAATAGNSALAEDQPVSFRNDVMAVLSKAGCNAGVCHGNKNGKGGLKLSLRGEDPAWDHAVLSRGYFGRRADPASPERSLILQKPTLEIAHEGGRRFAAGSREYNILRQWIAAGLPDDAGSAPKLKSIAVSPREAVVLEPDRHVKLSVRAIFDGHEQQNSPRDVTDLAVYEPTSQLVTVSRDGLIELARRDGFTPGEVTVLVRFLGRKVAVRLAFVPARPDFVWQPPPEKNYIDRHVFARLKTLRMNPSPPAGDSVFLRRAFIDLLGVLPTADEARSFVADARPDKRERLIDSLLDRPEFADHFALKLSDLLKNEERTIDRKGVQNFHHYLRTSIAAGKPWGQLARELVSARGSTYTEPATNFYRANRDPVERAEAASLVFLGTRLQCAKCHNHPFDRWTQGDYYSWAALFDRVDYKILENNRRDDNDSHEFDGEQIVYLAQKPKSEVLDPRTGQPAPPRFLGGQAPEGDDELESLAAWLTRPDNRLFAAAGANRLWYHVMGRGIVEPVDEFRDTNPPANPELLDALADDFVAHGFDVRHLLRTIMTSQAYALSAEPNDTNAHDESQFSHAAVRRLSAEQLLDAASQVLDVRPAFGGYPEGIRAGQIPGVMAVRDRRARPSRGDSFLRLFGKPPRSLSCDCERASDMTLGQVIALVSGPLPNDLLTRSDNRLQKLLDSGQSIAAMIDELYWSSLARAPTAEERDRLVAYVSSAADRRQALEDVAWGLLNSSEFLFRR